MEQEKKSERRERPNLSDSQGLVSHTYDMFLTSQTRIFTLSRYIYDGPASEIDIRLRTLFMEDILSFSISARRLIELIGLKSVSNNKAKIDLQYLDTSRATEAFLPTGNNIGFLSFANKAIHSQIRMLFLHRLDYDRFGKHCDDDIASRYALWSQLHDRTRLNENREKGFAHEPILVVKTDTDKIAYSVLLKDLVDASVIVMEKIVDVCCDSGIYLGYYRQDPR
jgi:hypothetical protein